MLCNVSDIFLCGMYQFSLVTGQHKIEDCVACHFKYVLYFLNTDLDEILKSSCYPTHKDSGSGKKLCLVLWEM
jgi:hypothetical protein